MRHLVLVVHRHGRARAHRKRPTQVPDWDIRLPLGYGLFGRHLRMGWVGGSLVMIDPQGRMTVAYVTNQMREPADDNRGLELVMAASVPPLVSTVMVAQS